LITISHIIELSEIVDTSFSLIDELVCPKLRIDEPVCPQLRIDEPVCPQLRVSETTHRNSACWAFQNMCHHLVCFPATSYLYCKWILI